MTAVDIRQAIEPAVDVLAAAELERSGATHAAGLLALATDVPKEALLESFMWLAFLLLVLHAEATKSAPLDLLSKLMREEVG